ncbi:hypothetical protein D3C72_560500 [compost metagenome]
MNPAPYDLRSIERTLYKQLVAMALVSLGVFGMLGAWGAAVSATVGVVAAILYYMMLGVQVRKQVAIGRPPHVLAVIASLFSRQVVSLAAPAVCFFYVGEGWWASLITLVVARHWVMVAGWSRPQAAIPHVSA